MKTLAKTISKSLIAVVVISAFATPAHAEISKSSTVKKVVKVKSIKAKKAKFLTTSANLETTTATPTPTPTQTPLDPNAVMMAKLMELVKALVDSNSAALAALKQPANSLVTTVSPVITVNPTVTSTNTNTNQQVQTGSTTPVSVSAGVPSTPRISVGHEDHEGDHR